MRGENRLLLCSSSPSSPVTVLKLDLFSSYEFDLRSITKKRKRGEVDKGL